ncbi:hypothetical protein DERP_008294 [Dermatophagoides pteronyssinus]|uniref:Uncharacterized protein n=1 Tax=Dermatophagoides pteronyssinus TaxID=6956 RepID=A0ABQ8J676_DERPT|nr:hypothetical protein DERP_008294 [Dermatophagoides pteronyssinus]
MVTSLTFVQNDFQILYVRLCHLSSNHFDVKLLNDLLSLPGLNNAIAFRHPHSVPSNCTKFIISFNIVGDVTINEQRLTGSVIID